MPKGTNPEILPILSEARFEADRHHIGVAKLTTHFRKCQSEAFPPGSGGWFLTMGSIRESERESSRGAWAGPSPLPKSQLLSRGWNPQHLWQSGQP